MRLGRLSRFRSQAFPKTSNSQFWPISGESIGHIQFGISGISGTAPIDAQESGIYALSRRLLFLGVYLFSAGLQVNVHRGAHLKVGSFLGLRQGRSQEHKKKKRGGFFLTNGKAVWYT